MPRSRFQSGRDKIVRLCLDGGKQCFMRSCTRLVMVCYAFLMLKPVMPILLDNMAHSLWASQHYRTVHKHGGEEHVHFELQKAAKDDTHNRPLDRSDWKTDTTPHVAAFAPIIVLKEHGNPRRFYGEYAFLVPETYTIPDYPPPRA